MQRLQQQQAEMRARMELQKQQAQMRQMQLHGFPQVTSTVCLSASRFEVILSQLGMNFAHIRVGYPIKHSAMTP